MAPSAHESLRRARAERGTAHRKPRDHLRAQCETRQRPRTGILGELGFGTQVLPVSGRDIQDEKILGTIHIATGRDDHLGGWVTPDKFTNAKNATHDDILFAPHKTPEINVTQARMLRDGKVEILIESFEPSPYMTGLISDFLSENIYESPRLLAEYLLLHYASAAELLGGLSGPAGAAGFARRLVQELLAPPSSEARALDLGCAVGASSFELTRSCSEVLGIDFSHSFIRAARTLAETGSHPFEKLIEGTITEPAVAHVPRARFRAARFLQGDAQGLPSDLGTFDIVLAANLLCRLPEPMRLIGQLPALIRGGGQLLLTTPFTWLEDFTPMPNWIGGTPASGRSFEALRALLDPHFELEHTADLPFLIREHSRNSNTESHAALAGAAAEPSMDWESHYQTGDMPWEKGAPAPPLSEWLSKNKIHGRVLVPGCGSGHDVRELARAGAEPIGLDLAPPRSISPTRSHASARSATGSQISSNFRRSWSECSIGSSSTPVSARSN